MIHATKRRAVLIALTGWTGRLLAVGLFLLWGAFFLEHFQWFIHPERGWPPARVWLLQGVHLIMLIGLLALLRWKLLGSALTVLGALAFFWFVAGNRFTAFFAVTILPAVLVLTAHFLQPASVAKPTQ